MLLHGATLNLGLILYDFRCTAPHGSPSDPPSTLSHLLHRAPPPSTLCESPHLASSSPLSPSPPFDPLWFLRGSSGGLGVVLHSNYQVAFAHFKSRPSLSHHPFSLPWSTSSESDYRPSTLTSDSVSRPSSLTPLAPGAARATLAPRWPYMVSPCSTPSLLRLRAVFDSHRSNRTSPRAVPLVSPTPQSLDSREVHLVDAPLHSPSRRRKKNAKAS